MIGFDPRTSDGHFRNPILPGDFADPDVIRVGDEFWMICSTFEYSPGMVLLRSLDLVTWSYAGHVVDDITLLGDGYRPDRMARDGRGIYAGSIREHDGLYYVYFSTLDEGTFVATAPHPSGPWTEPHLVWDAPYWDDPCPVWEPGGERAWLVASRPGEPVDDGWMTYLIPMAVDGMSVDPTGMTVLDHTWSSEGNKVYRLDGWYYVLHNESRGPGNRVAVIMRAESMLGPWTKHDLLIGTGMDRGREPNQGALVELDGRWWFLTHHGRAGYPEGRPVSLLPVTWAEGWPTVDGVDHRRDLPVPRQMSTREVLQTSDRFDSERLGSQWEWRYETPPTAWQLLPEGGLRLSALKPLVVGDPRRVPVCLTQRQIGTSFEATAVVDARGLVEGACFSLMQFGGDVSAIRVMQLGGKRLVEVVFGPFGQSLRVEHRVEVSTSERLHFRTSVDRRGFASYAISVSGASYTGVGDSYRTSWGHFRGNRLAMQCHNDFGDLGSVVVESIDVRLGESISLAQAETSSASHSSP